MSEIPWDSAFTLIGVIVGFSLSQLADLIKVGRNKRNTKNALRHELSVVKDSLSFAIDNDHKLPKDRLPIVTEVYDTSRSNLASILNSEQLLIVQKAYAQIKQVGSPMSSGTTLFRGYIELAGGDHVIYQHDLNEDVAVILQAIGKLDC